MILASSSFWLLLAVSIKAKCFQLPNELVDLDDFFELLRQQLVSLVFLVLEVLCLPQLLQELFRLFLLLRLGILGLFGFSDRTCAVLLVCGLAVCWLAVVLVLRGCR